MEGDSQYTFKSKLFKDGFQPTDAYIRDLNSLAKLGVEDLKAYADYLLSISGDVPVDDRAFLENRLGISESVRIGEIQSTVAFHTSRFLVAPDEVSLVFSDLSSLGIIKPDKAQQLTDFFTALSPFLDHLKSIAKLNAYKERGARVFQTVTTACRLVATFKDDFRVYRSPNYEYDPAADFAALSPVAIISLTTNLHSREEIVDFQADKWQLMDIIQSLSLTIKQLEMLSNTFKDRER